MKPSIFTLVLAAGLSGQALAQGTPSGTEHDAHHPQAAQEQTAAPMGSVTAQSSSTPAPNMQMPMGGAASQGGQRPGGMMSGMAQGMMSCPIGPDQSPSP